MSRGVQPHSWGAQVHTLQFRRQLSYTNKRFLETRNRNGTETYFSACVVIYGFVGKICYENGALLYVLTMNVQGVVEFILTGTIKRVVSSPGTTWSTNVVQFGGFPFDFADSSRISARCGGAF
jgi:hypothetical protein